MMRIPAAANRLAGRKDIAFVICGDGLMKLRLEEATASLPNAHMPRLQPVERLGGVTGDCGHSSAAAKSPLPERAPIARQAQPSRYIGAKMSRCACMSVFVRMICQRSASPGKNISREQRAAFRGHCCGLATSAGLCTSTMSMTTKSVHCDAAPIKCIENIYQNSRSQSMSPTPRNIIENSLG